MHPYGPGEATLGGGGQAVDTLQLYSAVPFDTQPHEHLMWIDFLIVASLLSIKCFHTHFSGNYFLIFFMEV